MTNLIETREVEERVILFAVSIDDKDDTKASLLELEELAKTAGAVTVGKLIQNREKVHSGTYFGKGKIEELADMVYELDATGVICDDELSPLQLKNLESLLDTKVIDRTTLILDIFAARAATSEGKLQVELAQLKYRSSRLIGLRSSLSRLGGGIGTRGPGEKKLEMDRRIIHERISQLKAELKVSKNHREVTRKQRDKSNSIIVSIVGYTNAGKSTLLNTLTGVGILAEDKLFATLDPTTRAMELPGGQKILLTDTVGFIRKLPHHLIEAFKSTLEEAKYADIILHVVDASNEDKDIHMHVVYETLEKLEVVDKEIITLFNKIDLVDEVENCRDFKSNYAINVSASSGQGLKELQEILEKLILARQVYIEKVFSYTEAGKIQLIRSSGQLISEEYTDDGILVKAYIPSDIYGKIN
jgi:GTP-binding protein HflX